jgi:hypothetical protein
MRRLIQGFLVLMCLGALSPVFAANERNHHVTPYQDPTDAERAEMKKRLRRGPQDFNEAAPQPEYHFPWLQIGMTALILGVAAPIGYFFFRRASKEQVNANAAFTPAPRRKKAAE